MKTAYYDSDTRAMVNLYHPEDAPDDEWTVTRVQVPRAEDRDKGIATRLLTEVCREADDEGVTLFIYVAPEEPEISVAGLYRLYEKFGFELRGHSGILMVRQPLRAPSTVR